MSSLKQLIHSLLKFLYILKFPMHRGKSNVGDLIEFLQCLHDIGADCRGCNLLLVGAPLLLELREHGIDLVLAHGALGAREPDSTLKLGATVRLSRSVVLDHNERTEFLSLKCREPMLALITFASPAYGATVIRDA